MFTFKLQLTLNTNREMGLGKPKTVPLKFRWSRWWFWILGAVCISAVFVYWFRDPILSNLTSFFGFLSDRDKVAHYVESFGSTAPLVFMAIQILQVILAPIPGEATGFIGGYIFGAFTGCFYSTIALTIGSWLNFSIGRFLGKRWVRRIIPQATLKKYDHLIRHQGMLVVFVLFLFPGFPKDYLCLILGVSTMPMRVFLLMAMIGRIPGTLMLSLQGALVYEKNYFIFSVIMAISAILVYLAYRYRDRLYRWVEKINGPPTATIDGDDH